MQNKVAKGFTNVFLVKNSKQTHNCKKLMNVYNFSKEISLF